MLKEIQQEEGSVKTTAGFHATVCLQTTVTEAWELTAAVHIPVEMLGGLLLRASM